MLQEGKKLNPKTNNISDNLTFDENIFISNSKDELQQNLITVLKTIFVGNMKIKEITDTENYVTLLSGLLILVLNNSKEVRIFLSEDNSKMCIIIDRKMEYSDFQLFCKLFEELTLYTLHFTESEGDWTTEILL